MADMENDVQKEQQEQQNQPENANPEAAETAVNPNGQESGQTGKQGCAEGQAEDDANAVEKIRAMMAEERLRMLADMENFKKRLRREHEEQIRYAAETVLSSLIPCLDNLDLAIQYGGQDPACKNMLMGVTMTRKSLLDTLKNQGFVPAGEVGEPFNPEIHEAVSYEERMDMEPGMVSTVLQKGYRLKDRLLRPAKVSISRKPEQA